MMEDLSALGCAGCLRDFKFVWTETRPNFRVVIREALLLVSIAES